MKTESQRWIWAVIGCALLMASRDAFALGSDYPNDRPVTGSTNWPKGMDRLVNATNRVHGFFVNAEDIFFFSGSASGLTAFLQEYSQLEGVASRRLILHDGIGEAKSPWAKTGRACDWKLYACPRGRHNLIALSKQATNSVEALQKAAKEPGYVVEVHFWTGGRIALDQIGIPKSVVVQKEK
jgi:hypothetical protein